MAVRRVYLDIVLVVFICQAVCAQVPAATGSSIAYVGETVTIDCPLTDNFIYPSWRGPDRNNTAQLQYTYEGQAAINPAVSNYISYATNNRTLNLMGVTTEDASTYDCSKTIGSVGKRGVHTLYVRVLPDQPVITASTGWVVSTGGVVSGTEGQTLTLTCVCRGGIPAPTLAWYRNTVTSTPVISTTPTDSSATSVTVTYMFTPVSNNDKQTYICQSSFTDPQPEAINQTSVQLYLNLKPSTPTVQQVGDATAGSNAKLQCDTSGFRPHAIAVSWKYKGTVHSGSLPTVSGLGNDKYRATSTLELPVQRGDNRGSVECIVTHSATLSSPLSETIAMNVLFAPVSVHVSGNTQTEVGTNPLTLTCTVGDANPAVSGYSWTWPGVGGKTTQTVTLRPTRHQDGDAVTCTARNTVGPTASQAVNLDLTCIYVA